MRALRILRWQVVLMGLVSLPAGARAPAPYLAPAPPELAQAIPLFTGEVPGANGPEQWDGVPGAMTGRNITQATLLPVLPDPSKSTGAAVVIAPGGAFVTLSWDLEGMQVARAMSDRGIAAFVLKYRLEPSPRDLPNFAKMMSTRMTNWIGKPGAGLRIETPPYPVEDGVAALRLIRATASRWHVDPARVGMIGFSAGARTTLAVTLKAEAADSPAFIGLIYPPMAPVTAPQNAPPMFVAMASDDPLFGRMGFGLIESWLAVRRPVEFHDYQRGGHGFGLGLKGTTTEGWIDGFLRWMDLNHFLKARPALASTTN